jgi:UDP-N-acetylglucosamine--N-acetylmuramyl-(pentapeptide) pyrophosphoryl-undecaprenol N-acetylglucosamine transferase
MFPACALYGAIREKGHDVTIITDLRGDAFCGDVSEKMVFDTIRLSRGNFPRVLYYSVLLLVKFLRFWFRKRPDIVIGFGGIFTVIPVVVSKILGSKVVIYEQNSVIGKANRFLGKLANLKLSSFKLEGDWREIPAPVREEFTRNVPYECDGILKILVIGGSQGAASFSEIVPKALAVLSSSERQNIEIVQQVGGGNAGELEDIYSALGVKATVKDFIRNVADVMLDSRLVICRSGASTLSELSATGCPAVLIPYPDSSDDHQLHNAMYYGNKKAAWMLQEEENTPEELGRLLRQILRNRELLKSASFHMMNGSVCRAAEAFMRLIGLV